MMQSINVIDMKLILIIFSNRIEQKISIIHKLSYTYECMYSVKISQIGRHRHKWFLYFIWVRVQKNSKFIILAQQQMHFYICTSYDFD